MADVRMDGECSITNDECRMGTVSGYDIFRGEFAPEPKGRKTELHSSDNLIGCRTRHLDMNGDDDDGDDDDNG